MSEKKDDLIEIVRYILNRQQILTKMLIHLGCRADLYDDFIRGCFDELDQLKAPDFEEV